MKKYHSFLLVVITALISFSIKTNTMNNHANIETFSISLSVKDIAESKAFYEKLGFTPVVNAGGLEQKWMLMENGRAKVGLFQGFFPENTITLNPDDARSIYKSAISKGLKPTYSAGLDQPEGPASFALTDPDGNAILIDQH